VAHCATPPHSVRRGEVWLVDFGDPVGREQAGLRPAVVVSADSLNESRAGVVIVVPLTTSRRGLPSHVEIETGASGLDTVSYAKCEDVKSASEARFVARLGIVDTEIGFQIGRTLKFLFDL
jgi:mRNA interferase MazF